jgi:hypothetical protein
MPKIAFVKKVALVGTISNAESNLKSDLLRVIRALSSFELVKIFLVESDSTDSTVSVLDELSLEIEKFDYISLGQLRREIPERINRIRHCRNVYVEKIRSLLDKGIIDYVIVADLDGMNSRISSDSIDSSFIADNWAAVLANQSGGYYDLLALRHPKWCPQDVMRELRIEQSKIDKSPLPKFALRRRTKRRIAFDRARVAAIYSKMRVIKKDADWIEVNSGFGGLAIYKSSIFQSFDYSLGEADIGSESEHVALSNKITSSGQRIYINPRMINNRFNTYNINRFLVIRQLRELYWNSTIRFRKLSQK